MLGSLSMRTPPRSTILSAYITYAVRDCIAAGRDRQSRTLKECYLLLLLVKRIWTFIPGTVTIFPPLLFSGTKENAYTLGEIGNTQSLHSETSYHVSTAQLLFPLPAQDQNAFQFPLHMGLGFQLQLLLEVRLRKFPLFIR